MRSSCFALLIRRLFRGLLAGLLATAPLWAGAEFPGRWPFKIYGPPEGIPSAPIHCLAQDRDGFLWLGSENGLFRFDGDATRRWGMAEGLKSDWVLSLAPQPDGGLWVGTNQGLMRFKDGRCTPVLLDGKPMLGPIFSLAADSNGTVWGISRALPFHQTGPDTVVALPNWPEGLMAMVVPGLAAGSMWILQSGYIANLRPDGTRRSIVPANGLPPGSLETLGEDGAGRLWVAGERKLYVLEPGASVFQDRSSLMPGGLVQLPKTLRDAHGDLWLPTTHGFLILEKGGGSRLLGPSQGLPLTWTRTLHSDHEGNLWLVGSGLVKLQGKGHVSVHQETASLPQGLVWSIVRTRSGELYAGTSDGVGRLGPQGWKALPGTTGLGSFSLLEEKDGTLLTVNIAKGLSRIKADSPPRPVPLPGADLRVNALAMDGGGRTWLGTSTVGAIPLDPAHAALAMQPGEWNLSKINVSHLAVEASGRLWASTLQGLYCRDNDRWRRFGIKDGLLAEDLLGVSSAPDGSIWVWYDEPRGASRFRYSAQRLVLDKHIGPGQGLGTALVYTVQEGGDGLTWVSTDQGVYLLKGSESRRLGTGSGLPANDCTANGALLDKDGAFWTGTVNGLVRIAPGAAWEVQAIPRTRILEAEWSGQWHVFPFSSDAAKPDAKGAFEFRFAAPAFADEESLRYQVRLVGLENEWRNTTMRQARYPALPGASYRFEVRAAQGDGPFGPPAAMAFRVRPPWWGSPWAITGYAATLTFVVYGLVRIRLAALARSKAQLEGVVALRTLELAEANCNLKEVNHRNQVLIEDLQKALAEVTALQGLIPICSYCKKIRDDGGAWNQMEQYISSRSKAKFSHGICPDCNKRVRKEAIKEGLLPPEPA